jgi:hypothetical protein
MDFKEKYNLFLKLKKYVTDIRYQSIETRIEAMIQANIQLQGGIEHTHVNHNGRIIGLDICLVRKLHALHESLTREFGYVMAQKKVVKDDLHLIDNYITNCLNQYEYNGDLYEMLPAAMHFLLPDIEEDYIAPDLTEFKEKHYLGINAINRSLITNMLID